MMFSAMTVVFSLFAMTRGFSSSFHGGFNMGGYSSSQSSSSSNNCPQQVDFSADLQLSTDFTGFPQAALDAELINRPTLAACLFREMISATAPQVPDDPALVTAQDTCPHTDFTLASYFNHNARCWIIYGLQETVNFTVCGTQRCVGCDDFFSGWGSETRCVRLYKYVSVWAICEGLPLNSQIVRERIVLPFACNCQKVRCYSSSFFWKKK